MFTFTVLVVVLRAYAFIRLLERGNYLMNLSLRAWGKSFKLRGYCWEFSHYSPGVWGSASALVPGTLCVCMLCFFYFKFSLFTFRSKFLFWLCQKLSLSCVFFFLFAFSIFYPFLFFFIFAFFSFHAFFLRCPFLLAFTIFFFAGGGGAFFLFYLRFLFCLRLIEPSGPP